MFAVKINKKVWNNWQRFFNLTACSRRHFALSDDHCESNDQSLSRLAAFIRTSLHSAVTSPRAHLFGIVLFQKPRNRDTFLVACLHRSIFKQQNSLKCATDLIWQAHDCASTSNHGLCSMNGNRSLLCGVIRTDGKNVGALVKSVEALRKNVKPIFKTVEYPSTVH